MRHGEDEYDNENNGPLSIEGVRQVLGAAKRLRKAFSDNKIKEVTIKYRVKKRVVESATLLGESLGGGWLKVNYVQDPLLDDAWELKENDAIQYHNPIKPGQKEQEIILSHRNTLSAILWGTASKLAYNNPEPKEGERTPNLEDMVRLSDLHQKLEHGDITDDFGNKL